jgi:hypothetical protein
MTNLQMVVETFGLAGTTVKQTSSDTASLIYGATKAITAMYDSSNNLIDYILMTVETNDIKFAFNGVPVAGAAGLGHTLQVGQSLVVQRAANIKALKVISAVAGVHGTVQITPFYTTK